jgi:hypothetical protein
MDTTYNVESSPRWSPESNQIHHLNGHASHVDLVKM